MKRVLSALQRASLAACIRAARGGQWHRAESSGERVTLASLFTKGLVERRTWRGLDDEPNAAHEYRASAVVMTEVASILTEKPA